MLIKNVIIEMNKDYEADTKKKCDNSVDSTELSHESIDKVFADFVELDMNIDNSIEMDKYFNNSLQIDKFSDNYFDEFFDNYLDKDNGRELFEDPLQKRIAYELQICSALLIKEAEETKLLADPACKLIDFVKKDFEQQLVTRKRKQKTLEHLFKVKAHFGHKVFSPKMVPFLAGIRHKMSIFELEKTLSYLEKALSFIYYAKKGGCSFLFLNTDSRFSKIVETAALTCGENYAHTKWVGGTLTNKRLARKALRSYLSLKQNKHLLVHLKGRSFARAQERFWGWCEAREQPSLNLPDVIIMINPSDNIYAIREARKLNIPVVSLVDSDLDFSFATYPIPGNDDSLEFVHYFLDLVTKTLQLAQDKALEPA